LIVEISEAILINSITLLAVLNPPLQIPISGSLLREIKEKRVVCIFQAVITALVILTLFACFGNVVLRFIGISINSFSVAGGALLFIIGVQIMTTGKTMSNGNNDDNNKPVLKKGGCAVPIGTPFIAGPGAITVTTLMIQDDPLRLYIFPIVTIISILVCLFVTTIVLYYSDKFLDLLTEEGSNVLARIMGIIIAAIGVEYVATGVLGLLAK